VLGTLLVVLAFGIGSGQVPTTGVAPHPTAPSTRAPSPVFGNHPIRHPATVPAHPF
jgi:hypothetical protein